MADFNSLAKKLRIMVVDDEQDAREFIGRFLSREGYDIFLVSNGEEAISNFQTYKPQILLLDIRMPGMDGIECLEKIKAANKEVCVIMVTVVQDEEAAKKSVELGAYDYITKPIDLDYLKLCIFTKAIFIHARHAAA